MIILVYVTDVLRFPVVINGIYFVAIYPNATAMIPNTTLPATYNKNKV